MGITVVKATFTIIWSTDVIAVKKQISTEGRVLDDTTNDGFSTNMYSIHVYMVWIFEDW